MNFEGKVVNTFPINVMYPYDLNRTGNNIYIPQTSSDTITLNNSLDKYLDQNTLNCIVKSNPEIVQLLHDYNIPPTVNVNSFRKNVYNHSIDTKKTAIGIYNNLPADIKNNINLQAISQAALLHDMGKIVIPTNILTKQNRLNPKEEEIIQLHPILGYEILKNQNINDDVLSIIKYHHQNPTHTGYPLLAESKNIDLNTQIVSMADKYSALKEQRSYKRPLSTQETLNILHDELNKGVSPDVYNALYTYAISYPDKQKSSTTLSNYLGIKNAAPQQMQSATFYG